MGILNLSEKDGRLVARAVIKALSGGAEPMSKQEISLRRMEAMRMHHDAVVYGIVLRPGPSDYPMQYERR